MPAAADPDELQLRVGLTVSSAEGPAASAGPARGVARRFEREVVPRANRVDRRIASLSKNYGKQFARYALGMALTEAYEELLPNNEQNAFTALKTLGVETAVGGLFMGMRYGPILGLIIGTLKNVQEGVQSLKDQVEGDQKRFQDLEKRTERRERAFQSKIILIDQSTREIAQRTRDRIYQELRQGY